MAEYEIGSLVRSKAGHDAGGYFIIIREEAEYVYLADGKTRSLEKPKRKKKKHVQQILREDKSLLRHELLREKLTGAGHVTNEDIRYFLKQWRRGDEAFGKTGKTGQDRISQGNPGR